MKLAVSVSRASLVSGETEGFAQPEDVAILMQTSGTTSRPKLVPLTHLNLWLQPQQHRNLQLSEADRYLNIMPLFHIHSLLLILSTLLSGGSVIAAPTYEPGQFFEWLDELKPTWYSAAPTLHQAILAEATNKMDIIARRPLRLIRSSAAPLPIRVMAELERVFQAPVIEAYGMTETPFPVTSNPLPPGKRKPGSVGIPAGPEVQVMDEAWQHTARRHGWRGCHPWGQCDAGVRGQRHRQSGGFPKRLV